MKLYSIKDLVSEEFGPIFSQVNDGTAVRAARNTLASAPPYAINDFRLYGFGSFDVKSGKIVLENMYEVEGSLFVNPSSEKMLTPPKILNPGRNKKEN